jgi:CDP-diacylglycerol--glycerol-3-phosphate 3-phosphatidyltransferase/cardiolipin synthase
MIPNLLSMIRFPLAIGFMATETTGVRLVLLGMASATDLLDGWLARRFGRTTRLGALLDPIADKIFMLSAFTAFFVHGELTLGQLAVFLMRDIAITIGAIVAWLVPGLTPRAFQARMSGKIVTVLQLAAILALTLAAGWTSWIVQVVGLASIVSIADYTLALAWALERTD